jgi:hypothetical protein
MEPTISSERDLSNKPFKSNQVKIPLKKSWPTRILELVQLPSDSEIMSLLTRILMMEFFLLADLRQTRLRSKHMISQQKKPIICCSQSLVLRRNWMILFFPKLLHSIIEHVPSIKIL